MPRPFTGGQSGIQQLEAGWLPYTALGVPLDLRWTNIDLRYRIFWLAGRRMVEWRGGVRSTSLVNEAGQGLSIFQSQLPIVPAWGREDHDVNIVASSRNQVGERWSHVLNFNATGSVASDTRAFSGAGMVDLYFDNVRYECSDVAVAFSPDNPRQLAASARRGINQLIEDWTPVPYIDTGGTQWNSGLPDFVYRLYNLAGRTFIEFRGQIISDTGDRSANGSHQVNTLQAFDQWRLVGADGTSVFQQLHLIGSYTSGLSKSWAVAGISGNRLSIEPHAGSDAEVFYMDHVKFNVTLI